LVEKSGKSASHIYARLSLLQLIPKVAEAFTQERITASHANLIARLPQESQAEAFEQCWRKDWQDSEPHLLPAKHVSTWIQNNLYLELADAPFDREDSTLNPAAGACVTCPRRSGYNTSLFSDVSGDQCLDENCYQIKLTHHLDREVAARPELIQIENGWRNAKEQRPGAVQRGVFREIETVAENPDAEPAPPCAASKPAIIVYGTHADEKRTEKRFEEVLSKEASRSLNPQRESAHRLPLFSRRRRDDVSVHLQTQSRRAGQSQVRTASPLQPRA
jgi:ParB family chromosome partitioning protein